MCGHDMHGGTISSCGCNRHAAPPWHNTNRQHFFCCIAGHDPFISTIINNRTRLSSYKFNDVFDIMGRWFWLCRNYHFQVMLLFFCDKHLQLWQYLHLTKQLLLFLFCIYSLPYQRKGKVLLFSFCKSYFYWDYWIGSNFSCNPLREKWATKDKYSMTNNKEKTDRRKQS